MSEPQFQSATTPSKPSSAGSVKDTIESILVAFILAFVFRAFVVEAFVIPTGSMATTLLGAHTRFHCPDCGYDFDVNYQAPVEPGASPESDDANIPSIAAPLSNAIYCPNCGFHIPGTDSPPLPGDADHRSTPPVFYGDRILVLKYLYMLEQPERYDVVVFKAPIQMTTNYIKRLIGKPGESVMVIDGDVYIRSADAKDPTDFVVQPKPRAVQDAMWRLVYDNDYQPNLKPTDQQVKDHPELKDNKSFQPLDRNNVQPWQQPWTVIDGAGWNLNDLATRGRTFRFDGDNTSSRLRFDPAANPTAQTTSEYLVYDQQSGEPRNVSLRASGPRPALVPGTFVGGSGYNEIWVSDLNLRLTYQRSGGDGPLRLVLTKRDHIFTAEITPGQATLYQDFDGKRTTIGSPMAINATGKPIRIDFSNADYQVTLRINGEVAAQSTPSDFSPNMKELIAEYNDHKSPPPGKAEIEAASQHCQISHLSLWRDSYYYNRDHMVRRATPDNFPSNAVVLNKDEYFVMGDNSILSYDARCWGDGVHLPSEQLDVNAGRVPARFLLGKAFYVYWPAGYQAYPGWPAFVPNFGAMRFIH